MNHTHHPRRVLLLLDVQTAMLSDPPLGIPASHTLRKNISHVLAEARNAKHPPLIVHVRNTGEVGEPDEPNTSGWQLYFTPLPNEPVIDKLKNNAFAGTRLGDLIRTDAEIVVVGMQSDFSVRASESTSFLFLVSLTRVPPPPVPAFDTHIACSAALGRGNEILLIRGAHGTYDRFEVLYGGGVTPATRIENEIEEELEEAGVHLLDMKDLPEIFTDR